MTSPRSAAGTVAAYGVHDRPRRVAFVGLGHMGSHMCRSVTTAGHEVTAYDLDRRAVRAVVRTGARGAKSLPECVEGAEVLITSLPGPPQVRLVLCGPDGAIARMDSGALVIEMSTSSREVGREVLAAARARRIDFVDAPVAGQIFHLGPSGSGYAVKLLLNLMWFMHAIATAEALTVGVRAGVDLERLHTALVHSPANSGFLERDVRMVLDRGDYDEGFAMKLVTKDLGLAVDLARDAGVPVEMASLVEQLHRRARVTYGDDAGEMSAIRLYEDAVGVSLRAHSA